MTTTKIERRSEQFCRNITTAITQEIPAVDNPFHSQQLRIHGYDLFELIDKRSYTDVFYLLLRGELPNSAQQRLFQQLAVFLINLGPRHPATRAAINTAVGRTSTSHIVPVAVSVMSGDHNGAAEVEQAMRFLRGQLNHSPQQVAQQLLDQLVTTDKAELIPVAGFGTDFGGQSPLLLQAVDLFRQSAPEQGYFNWSELFVQQLAAADCGWRLAGVVAAVLLDLGFDYRQGGGVLQLLAAPGAFAHGVDFANRPITDVPFLPDDEYLQGIFNREATHD